MSLRAVQPRSLVARLAGTSGRSILLLAALGLGLSACNDAPPPPVAAAPATPFVLGGDPGLGQRSFATVCANCHGASGDGKGEMASFLQPPPPDLHDGARQAKLTDHDLFVLIRDGGPAIGLSPTMGGVGGVLSDSTIRDLAAYVRSLAKPQPRAGH